MKHLCRKKQSRTSTKISKQRILGFRFVCLEFALFLLFCPMQLFRITIEGLFFIYFYIFVSHIL